LFRHFASTLAEIGERRREKRQTKAFMLVHAVESRLRVLPRDIGSAVEMTGLATCSPPSLLQVLLDPKASLLLSNLERGEPAAMRLGTM
jgi:hypothetical protein